MKVSPLFFFVLCFVSIALSFTIGTRTIGADQIVKIRCSLNVEDETFFFFNGTVIAYLTNSSAPNNTVVFNTIGVNVGRCFKNADGSYTLASRELLYYLDPSTNQIINRWYNPWTMEGDINVAHVDNDPVLQNFVPQMMANLQIYDDKAFLNLDIPLLYPNPLGNNPTFAAYSPQPRYQAGEFFKFEFPAANIDESINTVDYALVSWTREGPWLPWMKMGSIQGHLIYSSSGARIPSWEYLPAGVKADFENRIPHYKHAPTCNPDTRSVTSWTFFLVHFQEYLNYTQFPLATPAQYGCKPNTQIPDPPTPSTRAPTPTPTLAPCSRISGAFQTSASFATIITMLLVAYFL